MTANTRNSSLGVVAAGFLLAASPWYWPSLVAVLDAAAVTPSVAFPFTVGAVFVLVGGLARLLSAHERLRFDRIAAATVVLVGVAWSVAAAVLGGRVAVGWPVLLPFVVGVGAAGIAFPVGAAPDDRRRLLLGAVAVAMLVPYVGRAVWLVASGTGGTAQLVSAAGLVVGVIVAGLPLYRLGTGLDVAE